MQASELPWKEPVRLPQFSGLSGRLESLAEDFKVNRQKNAVLAFSARVGLQTLQFVALTRNFGEPAGHVQSRPNACCLS